MGHLAEELRKYSGIILPHDTFVCVSAGVCHFKKDTRPIRTIYHEVCHFDLEKRRDRKEPLTKIMGLSALHESLFDMQSKVESSMQKQLILQRAAGDTVAHACASVADKSQLFVNSLGAIQSMAEEGMAIEIITMCQAISRILRYIFSDTGTSVRLHDEQLCTEDF